MFFDLLNYGNCACDPIFRLDFRPQMGCALAHRLIGQSLLNRLPKSFNGQFLTWNRFWPNPQFRYALPPKWLITKEGDHDRRNTCPETGGCRSSTTVMYYGRDAREEPRKGDRIHHKNGAW
jgi:hypothetical protein